MPNDSRSVPHWSRFIVVGLVSLILLVAVSASTASLVLADLHPRFASSLSPFAARADANSATLLLGENPRPEDVGPAAALAAKALAEEPVSVVAARTLGITRELQGDSLAAARLMRYADSLSKRDSMTQLWLIEHSVQADDIPEALIHYDRALRVKPSLQQVLLPILVTAGADPVILGHLVRLGMDRPPWWREFVDQVLSSATSSREIEGIVAVSRFTRDDEPSRIRIGNAVSRLMTLGDAVSARQLYQRFYPDIALGGIRNGSFESDRSQPPFDWSFSPQPGLAGVREARDGDDGEVALGLLVDSGSGGGEIARQMLLLSPGHYHFSMLAGDLSTIATPPTIVVQCVEGSKTLMALRVEKPRPDGHIVLDWDLPPGSCAAQWLFVIAGPPSDSQSKPPWIDRLEITPRP